MPVINKKNKIGTCTKRCWVPRQGYFTFRIVVDENAVRGDVFAENFSRMSSGSWV